MHIKKLVGGASAFALLAAGSASALTLTAAAPKKVAQEVDFANGVAGTLPELTVKTTSALPNQGGYRLTINLTGGATFNNLAANLGTAFTGTGVTNAIISTGGSNTDTTVTVLFDVSGAGVGTTNPITLKLPVKLSSNASPIGTNINLTNNTQAPIEGGTASLTDGAVTPAAINAINFVNAFKVTLAPDVDGASVAQNSLLSLKSSFKNFLATAPDTTTTARIGDVAVAVDTTAFGADLSTPVAPANIAGLSYDVEFVNTTGVSSVDHVEGTTKAFAAPATATKTGSTYSVKITTPALAATAKDNVNLTLTGAAVVSPQVLKVTNTKVDLVTGFVDEAATVTGDGVDDLQLEGASFGPFDWVGDTSTIATTVFRVTGLKAKPTAVVTIANSSGSKDGTYTLDLSGKTLSGAATTGSSQLVLTNADVQAAVGSPFGIADVTFTFFTADTVDVDRLLATGGIVSAFGDTGNSNNAGLTTD